MMKTFVTSIVLATAGLTAAAPAPTHSAWQWQSPLTLTQAGMTRLEVPPALLDLAQPELADLRLLSPDGRETPYLIEIPRERSLRPRQASGFKVALEDETTVIEAQLRTSSQFANVTLVSPAAEFVKSVTIRGRQGDGSWQVLATHELIFRQANGRAERLTLPIPPAAWSELRLEIDDQRSKPVPFTALWVAETIGTDPTTRELPVIIGPRSEEIGNTRVTLDLGARNLHLAEVTFDIADRVFSRNCALTYQFPDVKPGQREHPVANGILYRLIGEGDISTANLTISRNLRVPTRNLTATFHDGSSPPLSLKSAKIRYFPSVLMFHASSPGAWRVLVGNPEAKTPDYDLARLRGELASAGSQQAMAGPPGKHADYRPPTVLPGIDPAGAEIDLTNWSRRRAVTVHAAGVVGIELDDQVLAASRRDLGDVRLVQNGRQIPYLIHPDRPLRSIKPELMLEPRDPKHPSVSRWRITLPRDGIPLTQLTMQSTATMFSRHVSAWATSTDDLGNSRRLFLGDAAWTRSSGQTHPLVMNLRGGRSPQVFSLETDHGDNPAIDLTDVRADYAAPQLVAKLTSAADLSLCYGNPAAVPPRYDLSLVEAALLAAKPATATLGSEELLRNDPNPKRGPWSAGSPWLWLALATVIAVLLWVVAKLLPRPNPDPEPGTNDPQ